MRGGFARDVLSFCAFAPAAGLAVAAGAAGMGSPAGIGCAVAALGWAAADLIAIDPRVRHGSGGTDDVATAFMRRALRAGNVEDVARDLAQALAEGGGPTGVPRAAMIAPKPDGGVRVIALAGAPPDLGDTAVALDWLGFVGESLERDAIARSATSSCRSAIAGSCSASCWWRGRPSGAATSSSTSSSARCAPTPPPRSRARSCTPR